MIRTYINFFEKNYKKNFYKLLESKLVVRRREASPLGRREASPSGTLLTLTSVLLEVLING